MQIPRTDFSILKRRATSTAIPTGNVPRVKMNCIAFGGISSEPNLAVIAHAPQQATHRMEYENQPILTVRRKIMPQIPPDGARRQPSSRSGCVGSQDAGATDH